MSLVTTIDIIGMTCSHCVSSVTAELATLDGVTDVAVELNTGGISTATIRSCGPLVPAQVSDAIADAGYHLAPGTE